MNWSELALTVDEIIGEFGQTVAVLHPVYGEYNVDTGQVSNSSTSTVTKGVMFDYGEKDVNGTTILRGDKRLLIKPTGTVSVEIGDTITVNNKQFNVVNVIETNPAGTNLLFEVSLRGIS